MQPLCNRDAQPSQTISPSVPVRALVFFCFSGRGRVHEVLGQLRQVPQGDGCGPFARPHFARSSPPHFMQSASLSTRIVLFAVAPFFHGPFRDCQIRVTANTTPPGTPVPYRCPRSSPTPGGPPRAGLALKSVCPRVGGRRWGGRGGVLRGGGWRGTHARRHAAANTPPESRRRPSPHLPPLVALLCCAYHAGGRDRGQRSQEGPVQTPSLLEHQGEPRAMGVLGCLHRQN